jgi:hypothetical protein
MAKEALYALASAVFALLLLGHLLYTAARAPCRRGWAAGRRAREMYLVYMEAWGSAPAWSVLSRESRERRSAE